MPRNMDIIIDTSDLPTNMYQTMFPLFAKFYDSEFQRTSKWTSVEIANPLAWAVLFAKDFPYLFFDKDRYSPHYGKIRGHRHLFQHYLKYNALVHWETIKPSVDLKDIL